MCLSLRRSLRFVAASGSVSGIINTGDNNTNLWRRNEQSMFLASVLQ
ncbi:hypothetical protein [Nostoc sp. CCY 9925]